MKVFEKEIDIYKNSFETYLNDINDQSKKKKESYKCKLYISRLERANKRFLAFLIFSIIIVLVVATVEILDVIPTIIILFAIPYFITHADSDLYPDNIHIFRKVEENIIQRNLHATIVYVVFVGSLVVASILTW